MTGSYRVDLMGAFRLSRPDGSRIDVSSKRGQAMIAMLAVAGSGERTRIWLQSRLWGSRSAEQAQASLRRELSTLRQALNKDLELLGADHGRIWLDLENLDVDVRGPISSTSQFLEGLDIGGEEDFEDWLRDERARLSGQPDNAAGAASESKVGAIGDFELRPAVAVLPFANLTSDPDITILAENLSEDLIDRLSRLRWLPVIARSSSFALGEGVRDARRAGPALGARYILDGQIKRDIGGPALAIALTDAVSGQLVWSGRIEIPETPDRDVLHQLITAMATNLGIKIDQQEQARVMAKPQSDLNVSDLIWRGRWHRAQLTLEDGDAAIACFEQALRQEPNSPEALIQLTWAIMEKLWATRATDDEIRHLRQQAQKAIIADYDDARGHMLAGIAEIWLRQPLRAEALLKMAVKLNPSLVIAHEQLGTALSLCGNYAEAIERFEFAIRLSPNDEKLFFLHAEMAMAHLLLGDCQTALTHAEYAIARRMAYWQPHVVRINALIRLGRMDEARRAHDELQKEKPRFTADYIDWIPFIDGSVNVFLKQGLNLLRG